MRVAVVYESVYGNTRTIAEALGDGVRDADPGATVAVLSVDEAPPERVAPADLVLVGGPTHAFGMSRASTRRQARERSRNGVPGATTTGVREWLDTLPSPPAIRRVAAFSTRMPSRLAGDAARGITRRLRSAGHDVADPQSFVVRDSEGPLRAGEIERARAWAAGLTARAAGAGTRPEAS
jgi:hypothetical protein